MFTTNGRGGRLGLMTFRAVKKRLWLVPTSR